MTDKLKNIIYISLPDNISGSSELPLDPSILLPVELIDGEQLDGLKSLSWEMIVSAMLKVLAYQPEHKDADYFRNFVSAVKPGIRSELINAGIVKAGEKEFDLAEELFLSVKGLNPEDSLAGLNLALLYEERADFFAGMERIPLAEEYNTKAFEAYKDLLINAPENEDVHFNCGMFFLKQNNIEKAEEHLSFYAEKGSDSSKKKHAVSLLSKIREKKETDAFFLEAYDSIRLGREDEAVDLIKQFLLREPDVWNGWFLLGWAYRRKSMFEEGRDAFMKAVKLGAEQVDAYNELAICLMECNAFEESRSWLEKALRLEPENIKIISNLGILSLKQNNSAEALNFFKMVETISPGDPLALKYIKELEN